MAHFINQTLESLDIIARQRFRRPEHIELVDLHQAVLIQPATHQSLAACVSSF